MPPRPLVVLEEMRIPAKCQVSWDGMVGDDRTRFCESCGKNVHDLKKYTRGEAAELFASPEPPCVILTKTSRGRVLTADDSFRRGWWKPLRFFALLWAMLTAALGSSTGCYQYQGKPAPRTNKNTPPADANPPDTVHPND